MSNKMIKAIYSASLHLRFQMYEDGTTVGFSNPRQTKTMATERVMRHVIEDVNPHLFGIDTPENDAEHIAQADDWVTIYEAK